MMPAPAISSLFVLGKPATGKSTISKIILHALDLPEENYFPIDKAHHLLCNPDVHSPHFYYTADGTLIFRNRAAMMREALEWLARAGEQRLRTAPHVRPLLFEFAHYDYPAALQIFGENIKREAAIIEIVAPFEVAHERNRSRPAIDRVPLEWLQMAYAADTSQLALLVGPGKFVQLHNELALTPKELQQRVITALQALALL